MSVLAAAEPPRVRDEVRLLVARDGAPLVHTTFLDLPTHLRAGDLLVVNASATLPAALPARRADGSAVDLHLSTPDPSNADRWVVEVRRHGRRARAATGTLALPAGGEAHLLAPYLTGPGRLWIAKLDLPTPLLDYLHAHGAPIRYAHEPRAHPLEDYQTVFATEPGSAEMPSAGRPFTPRALSALRE
ncbi:MAG TPA: S-adenosylmethionine:tRNA ribosyltransferase-isomerase, partial [Solirubrobacter sp.]|nr:S-adenosylmethionine:tRNA ribosyltransferase-isomerase [Solirubrobacter sp.]